MSEAEMVPIAEAAAKAQVPIRSVYNWVKSRSIQSQKVRGVTCVRLNEVEDRAQTREAAVVKTAPMPAGTELAAAPAETAGTCALPVELLAHLIRLFEEGVPLQCVVQRLHLSTAMGLEARRQYEQLVAAGGQPSLLDRVNALADRMEAQIAGLEAKLEAQASSHAAAIQKLQDRLDAVVEPAQKEAWTYLQRLTKDFGALRQEMREADATRALVLERYMDSVKRMLAVVQPR